jgi:hypothetical protein
MTNKEIIEMVYKAKMVKPYARVHFPYSVEHVERILGITLNDEDRADMQRFYDTAEFFAQFDNESANGLYKSLYFAVNLMIDDTDFLSIEEAQIVQRSILRSCGAEVTMSCIAVSAFRFETDNTIWAAVDNKRFVFRLDVSQIRREINLNKLLDTPIEYVEMNPIKIYTDYGNFLRCQVLENDETLSSRL